MRIIIVDDEKHARNTLEKLLTELTHDEIVVFDRAINALNYALQNKVDIAFLDISMPEMNGVDLAKALKGTNRFVNVIFCTGYSEYMQQAINLHASGYLLKPADREGVKEALHNLIYDVKPQMPHVFIRTFGDFDVFVGGVAIQFTRQKSKELLAYLVHKRGGVANKKEIAAVLFEDDYSAKTQDYLKKIYKDLLESLKVYNLEGMIVKGFNQYALDNTKFSCDLYDYDKGLPTAINAYKGEYMEQYEWAEL